MVPVLRLILMTAAVLVAGCATHGHVGCERHYEREPIAAVPPQPAASESVAPATAAVSTPSVKPAAPPAVPGDETVRPASGAAATQAAAHADVERPASPAAPAPPESPQAARSITTPDAPAVAPKHPHTPSAVSATAGSPTPSAKVAAAASKVDAVESKPSAPASQPAAKSTPATEPKNQAKPTPKPVAAIEANVQTQVKPAPAAGAAKAEAAALDLKALEKQLKETKAIGVFTKLTLKNQVDDLLDRFRAYYRGQLKTTLSELRQPYDLLMLKVITLLQDDDPALARTINGSREAIWGILADPVRFSKY